MQLSDPSGFPVWPYSHEGRRDSVFDVQDEIVRGVVAALPPALGLEPTSRPVSTSSLEAYQLYLAALSENVATGGGGGALGLLEQALDIDPEFAEALSAKSLALSTMFIAMSPEAGPATLAAAEDAALRAIALAPDQGNGYAAQAQVLGVRGEWLDSQRAWMDADERGFGDNSRSVFLLAAGHLLRTRDVLEEQLESDPLNENVLGFLMVTHEVLGNSEDADEIYAQGQRLYDAWFGSLIARPWLRLGRGEIGPEYGELAIRDPQGEIIVSAEDNPEEALESLARLAMGPDLQPALVASLATWAAYFEDPELALRLLDAGVSESGSGLLMFLAWLPVFDEMRQMPALKDLLVDIGLVDFWRAAGWPDVCRPDGADFECG